MEPSNSVERAHASLHRSRRTAPPAERRPGSAARRRSAPAAPLAPLLAAPVAVFGGGVSGRRCATCSRGLAPAARSSTRSPAPARRGSSPAPMRSGTGWWCSARDSRPTTPGCRPRAAAGCTCLGELDFASLLWRGRLVAVTGTNGKTTLTEFLAHALAAAGETSFAVGQCRVSRSAVCRSRRSAADAIAVCEVSSFQAETLRHFRADATLWTNFAEDHLERHPGMQGLLRRQVESRRPHAARRGVCRQQRGSGLRASSAGSCRRRPASPPRTRRPMRGSAARRSPAIPSARISSWRSPGGGTRAVPSPRCSPPPAPSGSAGTGSRGWANSTASSFWNDSKATNFHAVEAALATFPAPVHLILGGRSKGGDLRAFVGPDRREVPASLAHRRDARAAGRALRSPRTCRTRSAIRSKRRCTVPPPPPGQASRSCSARRLRALTCFTITPTAETSSKNWWPASVQRPLFSSNSASHRTIIHHLRTAHEYLEDPWHRRRHPRRCLFPDVCQSRLPLHQPACSARE